MSQLNEPTGAPAGRELSTRSLIILLSGAIALGPFAIQIFVPALPAIQKHFEVDPAIASLGLSLSLWAIAISNLVVGPLSDKYGRRPVMLTGIIVAVLGSAIAALAPSVEVLILGRIIQAAGAASGMVLGRAITRDRYDMETATSIIGTLTAVMVVAPMFAPLVAGVLLDFTGWRATFWATFVISLLMLVLLWWLLAETNTNKHETEMDGVFRQSAGLFRIPLFRAYFFQTAFSATMWFSFMASGPYLMSEVLGRSSTEYGLWFIGISIVYMAGSFSAGAAGRRWGADRTIVGANLFSLAGGVMAIAFAITLPLSPMAIFLPCGIMLIGQSVGMPNVQTAAMSIDPKRAGAASGITAFVQMMSAGIAAQIVGTFQNETLWPMALAILFGATGGLSFAVRSYRLSQPIPSADM